MLSEEKDGWTPATMVTWSSAWKTRNCSIICRWSFTQHLQQKVCWTSTDNAPHIQAPTTNTTHCYLWQTQQLGKGLAHCWAFPRQELLSNAAINGCGLHFLGSGPVKLICLLCLHPPVPFPCGSCLLDCRSESWVHVSILIYAQHLVNVSTLKIT